MSGMKAIQIIKQREVSLHQDAPIPNASDGEVLIKNLYAGLCGSDMGVYKGEGLWANYNYPAPVGWMGHENIGTIVESRCKTWTPGMVVLAMPESYLGYAEYFISKPHAIVKLPLDKLEEHLFIVAQPLSTILRAMSSTEGVINKNCAIVGQGPIGLIFTNLLRVMGARHVIAIDPLDYRLDIAKEMGATHVTSASKDELVELIKEITSGEMINFCVEAVGESDALSTAVYITRRRGRLLIFGVPIDRTQEFPVYHVFRNEINIIASVGPHCASFFEIAVDMVSDGRLDLTRIVRPMVSWDKAADVFRMYDERAKGSLKAVLRF
jgi:L-iditol 2-dehydrogenase